MKQVPKFSNDKERDFTTALHSRVNNYFTSQNLSKNANGEMILKSVFHLSVWAGSYALIVFGGFAAPLNYLLWAILGFSIAMVCVNIGHDAIHGAYSGKPWVNKLLSHTFNINGASAYMWHKMHNTAHHTYTNVDGFDEDIDPAPILRVCPHKPLYGIHRFQYIYWVLIYGLSTLSWVFAKDYVKFFTNTVGNYNGKGHPKSEYFFLFFYKFLNYGIFLITPLVVIDQPWWQIVLGFLLMHYVAGMSLGIIFMLAHVVEETHFLTPDGEGKMEHSWAAHQLYTTANFSRKSWLASFLTGGLNQQVEHHLFPNMCSIHYRRISHIVKETAEEFGHPYYDLSFGSAVGSHLRFLKRMGHEEPVKSMPSTLQPA